MTRGYELKTEYRGRHSAQTVILRPTTLANGERSRLIARVCFTLSDKTWVANGRLGYLNPLAGKYAL